MISVSVQVNTIANGLRTTRVCEKTPALFPLSSKLPVLWTSSPVGIKEKLQKLVFPGGIYYNKQNGVFRTENVNSIFLAIAALSGNTGENEKGTNHSSNDLSPQAGIRLQPSNRFRNDLEEITGFVKQLGSFVDSN